MTDKKTEAQQQEPSQGKWVGTVVDSGKGYKVIGFGVDALADVPIGTRCYTSPPASKPWVGLTPKDIEHVRKNVLETTGAVDAEIFAYALDAKLKEKNNG